MQTRIKLHTEAAATFELSTSLPMIQYQACYLFIKGSVRLIGRKLMVLRKAWNVGDPESIGEVQGGAGVGRIALALEALCEED